jgi:chemotaxis protein methyltransferase CheR
MPAAQPRLGKREFDLLRQLILEWSGIRLAPTKRLLLQNRIGRRVRALGLPSFQAYYDYLCTVKGRRKERANLWSAVTTNETHFFREPHHFDVLRRVILPRVIKSRRLARTIRVWTAGCSTGQEPYTVAMVVDDVLRDHADWTYRVVATDIDPVVLETARGGRYPADLAAEIPPKYLMRHIERDGEMIQVRGELRRHVTFEQQNFARVRPLSPRADVIFCRNVIMYLDLETRRRLVEVFRDSLVDGGRLLLGSSESLHGMPRLMEVERYGNAAVYRTPVRAEDFHGGG